MKTNHLRPTLMLAATALAATLGACLTKEPNPGYTQCWNSTHPGPGCDNEMGIPPDLYGADLYGADLLMPDLRPMCATSADCADAAKPICDAQTHTCRPCADAGDNAACAMHSAATPRCSAATHQCGECAAAADCTDAKKPACDVTTSACRGCQTGAECPASLVCNDDGACANAADVLYVDNKNGNCLVNSGDGSMGKPLCEVVSALTVMPAKPIIHVAGSTTGYKPVTISTATTVRFVGPGAAATPTAKISGSGGPAVNVNVAAGTTTLTFDGMELRGDGNGMSDAVLCTQAGGTTMLAIRRSLVDNAKKTGINSNGCTIAITQSTVSGNTGAGISTSGGTVTITQSTVSGNTGAGISLSSGTMYDVENDFIYSNPGVGVSIDNTSMGTFAFNTVLKNGGVGTTGGILCGLITASPIQNSIVWSNGSDMAAKTQFAGKCTLMNVVTGIDTFMNAIQKDPEFVNLMAGMVDVHLKKGSAANLDCCVDKVMPGGPALPSVDHDNGHRPLGKGWDIGAHEVQ